MERLITVADMMERYGFKSPKTAKKRMREMFHYENPWGVPKWAFDEWEQSRAVTPEGTNSRKKAELMKRDTKERVIVPRTR